MFYISCRFCRGKCVPIPTTGAMNTVMYECAICNRRQLITKDAVDRMLEMEELADEMVTEQFLRIPEIQKYFIKRAIEKAGLGKWLT